MLFTKVIICVIFSFLHWLRFISMTLTVSQMTVTFESSYCFLDCDHATIIPQTFGREQREKEEEEEEEEEEGYLCSSSSRLQDHLRQQWNLVPPSRRESSWTQPCIIPYPRSISIEALVLQDYVPTFEYVGMGRRGIVHPSMDHRIPAAHNAGVMTSESITIVLVLQGYVPNFSVCRRMGHWYQACM